ncbi:hypothetical protein GHT06_001922 [Daphnia sinensis]|uniref:Uncharacterized protein n=1 Tax=Daphnia sinensis TaxID=1820382 RepID=A0AAD5KFX5_9CRUS|nr:hypothetical protein GHT06_001922 [Daphnia sinensis]
MRGENVLSLYHFERKYSSTTSANRKCVKNAYMLSQHKSNVRLRRYGTKYAQLQIIDDTNHNRDYYDVDYFDDINSNYYEDQSYCRHNSDFYNSVDNTDSHNRYDLVYHFDNFSHNQHDYHDRYNDYNNIFNINDIYDNNDNNNDDYDANDVHCYNKSNYWIIQNCSNTRQASGAVPFHNCDCW